MLDRASGNSNSILTPTNGKPDADLVSLVVGQIIIIN